MFKWTAEKAAQITKGTLYGDSNIEIRGCILDSRQAQGGEMFFALPGERVDGHDYMDAAWKNGAALVIAEEGYFQRKGQMPCAPEGKALLLVSSGQQALQELARHWRLELGAKVVGVTGSNGKTTTKDMISAVLAQRFRVYRSKENHNNELGLPLTILNSPPETEILVLEMGMRGLGEIKALCDIGKPDIGVITNIGTTHLELLLTHERIAQAKWELIEALPKDGIAILNAEDEKSVQKSYADPHRSLFYGTSEGLVSPDIQGSQLTPKGTLGTEFQVSYHRQKEAAFLPLPGKHNVLDALAALAVGTVFGISLADGCKGLRELEMSKMRLELRPGIFESMLINDVYNANPVSMQASLRILKERAQENKTVAILGEMYELGSAAAAGHREVGQTVAELGVSALITVGALAQDIAYGANLAGYPQSQTYRSDTKEEAIRKAKDLLAVYGPGTWVLIKGSRGMKMEEITVQLERTEKRME
ncbi:UDP-N-acetylmuramoyl-tripeptide--D-alanyl-D-alanine ligase [Desulfosporosinus acidiphilus SJ4]|uniref:UDP-N-acetylmuramoyl-tripeptide--D-alanyl-D-alanine ligase n=1 Tax=Desulfosporosinus acidiphilus (strain DSM 22704 / JCM 16185 / SJ4) TaxID=646529 RepID=I4DA18_DESAJ|nr:UDP-N-acetylmuramoyl-tripeptide--D-alanyl-D-alanine ligase [Desulfosporosinus acidiphilus]AFM42642.1 UDP-N-acetylmuramoyl-tripeptide--D-alanyl-D-alanine ligase [Desulfosporosinus acidiphilus SJ4]